MSDLVSRLRDMSTDKELDIGAAWNALDEAADALEALEALTANATILRPQLAVYPGDYKVRCIGLPGWFIAFGRRAKCNAATPTAKATP